MTPPCFAGLELLDTAVIILDPERSVRYLNPAAEILLATSLNDLRGRAIGLCFLEADELLAGIETAWSHNINVTEHEQILTTQLGQAIHASITISPLESGDGGFLLEFRQTDKQLRIANEERIQTQQQANRELIRNLAHEIKNPLGGIRGAAQLLQHELPSPALKEYTQVITQEADRLQALLDRLLTPNRLPHVAELNIHEVLERVRSLMLAEHPNGLAVRRDYDTSLPPLLGDKEQLIQVVLNIVKNAVQAMHGLGEIVLKTRIARQVTLTRRRFALALQLQIIDNGPGIPEQIRETLFYPLVSARPGGTGIGLHLAQTYIQQHHGSIEFDSAPGRTCFTILLPINGWQGIVARESK